MKRWVTNVLLVVFAIVFLVSGYFLVDYILDSRKEQGVYNDLAAIVEKGQQDAPQQPVQSDPDTPQQAPEDETVPTEPETLLTKVKDPETGEWVEILPEYAELYTINNDLVGWMYLEDTDINYPVMHHPETADYYLYKDFYEKYSSHGCFYIREACRVEPHTDNITIYGHNMYDGTMMADLHNYKKQSFWEDHKTITFNSLTEYRQYEILAVFPIEASVNADFQYHLYVHFADEEHFAEFADTCKALSLYDTGVNAEFGDKLITLSTCDRSMTNGRLVVVAKLITE